MAKCEHCLPITLSEVITIVLSLLVWENPLVSAVSLVGFNCLFWFFVSWNRGFVSIVAIVTLFTFVYRTWVKQIWPEIRVVPPDGEDAEGWTPVHPQVLSVPELSRYMTDFWQKMTVLWTNALTLRREHHGLFCVLGCLFFSALALLGHIVPGVLIIYIIVLGFSLGPGIMLHLIPATVYDMIAGLFGEEYISKEEDFLPESAALPDILSQVSLEERLQSFVPGSASMTETDEPEDNHMTTIRELGMDSFACESECSLYSGLGGFPSVEEENESDLDEDLPLDSMEQSKSGGIRFVPGHFKEGSSESDSDIFTEGLSFGASQAKENDEKNEESKAPKTSEIITKNIPVEKAGTMTASSDFDDDLTDFEILEQSDIDKC